MLSSVNILLVTSSATSKRGYHHGDLRNALVAAAADLAAKGGPGLVTVRAAAREVGVTPTAAYRHFAKHEDLLTAAKDAAMDRLTEAMRREVALTEPADDPVLRALGRFAAVGRAYLAFSRAEPGLFRTAFSENGRTLPEEQEELPEPDQRGPFQILLGALDELVEVGYLSATDRRLAEFAAWSVVHGLAVLLDGPLRELPAEVQNEAMVRSMIVLGHGLKGTGLTPEQESALVAELRRRR